MIIEPIRSAHTPFDLMPDRVFTKKSMSRMHASSIQHSDGDNIGDFDSDSDSEYCFFKFISEEEIDWIMLC